MSAYVKYKCSRICLDVIHANPVKRLRNVLIYIGSYTAINCWLSSFSTAVYCCQTYVLTLCLAVIDLICATVDVSVIVGVTQGLVGGTNATADTVAYWVVDTVNVKCLRLSSPKLKWIEVALTLSIIFVTEIFSYVGASLIGGRIECGTTVVKK